MAKKKALQKNFKSTLFTILAVVISLAILGASSIMATVNIMSNTIVDVNEDKISKSYFKYNLYNQRMYYESFGGADIWSFDLGGGQTMEQSAKSSALNTAISMKISKQEAVKAGITLTEEDNKKIEENIEKTKTSLGEEGIKLTGVTDSDIKEMATDQVYADKMYEDITKGFVMSQDDFEVFFQDYLKTNRQSLATYMVEYIHTNTVEEAQAAKARLDAGEEFETVAKETSVDYKAEEGYSTYNLSMATVPQEAKDAAFALSVGQTTDVVTVEEQGSYIVRVVNVEEPNTEELRPTQEEAYINKMKQEMYQAQYKTWEEASKIKVNSDLYNVITIKSISPAPTPTPSAEATEEVAPSEETAPTDETTPSENTAEEVAPTEETTPSENATDEVTPSEETVPSETKAE